MKTRLLLSTVMVMFTLASFSQNLEELNKTVEQLSTDVGQLQSKITVLEDKVPYYEMIFEMARRPQKLALLKFNVGNHTERVPFSYKGITVE